MDLKTFIVETIAAIADASIELQERYEAKDVHLNPPAAANGGQTYKVYDSEHSFRSIRDVEFDVAITTTSSNVANAGGSLKVIAIEVGAEGERASGMENASRVKFSLPISLRPSSHWQVNGLLKQKEDRERDQAWSKSVDGMS